MQIKMRLPLMLTLVLRLPMITFIKILAETALMGMEQKLEAISTIDQIM